MKRAILFVLAGLVAPSALVAQPPTIEQVIGATSDVHDVVFDGASTLLATSGGVVEAQDGRLGRTLTSRDGLPGNRVRSLSLVGDRVLAGGIEGTALLGRGDNGDLRVLGTLPIRRVSRAVEVGGTLYAISFGEGLVRIGADAAIVAMPLGRSHARLRLTDLAVVNGELWVASAGAGIFRVALDGTILTRVNERQGLGSDHVFALAARGDTLFVGTPRGLSVVRDGRVVANAPETRALAAAPVRDVRAIAVAGSALLVGTFGGGVLRVEGSRSSEIATSLRVRAVAARGDEVVIAHEAGLEALSSAGRRRVIAGGLPSSDVTALAHAFGALWVGTFDRGLAKREGARFVAVETAHQRWRVDRRINDLAVTRRGGRETLWIATDRGVFRSPDGRTFFAEDGNGTPGVTHVTALHVAENGALWVASSRALCRFDGASWRAWTGDPRFPVAQLHAVTTTASGEVWVGSLHGLFRFDPEHGTYQRHTVSSGDLPVDWVTALEVVAGRLVAGTYHGGLVWETGSGFAIERGAAPSGAGAPEATWVNPHAFTVLDGTLFVGTLEQGLFFGRRGAWARLGVADGLPSDDVTDVLALPNGERWVATRGGLARVSFPR